MDIPAKQRELEQLQARVAEIEEQLAEEAAAPRQPAGYYTAYYATTGFLLGMFGAAASLLFNIVGSLAVGQHPLKLIQVYLTFPLGEHALNLDSGLALAIGCCLYLATGMLYGMVFQVVLTRFASEATFVHRFLIVTALSLVVWLVNFYGILSWLQPMLFGGSWIVDRIPIWVAALTHLVFGWTMLAVYPLGLYTPYRLETDS